VDPYIGEIAMRKLLVAALGMIAVALAVARAEDQPAAKPLKALLVIGGCCHEYNKQKDVLTKGVSARANVEWTVSYDSDTTTAHLNPVYEKPDWAKGFDVVVHDECSSDVKDPAVIERILAPHKDGLPAVVLHCGMHCYRSEGFPKATPWFDFTGLPSTGHGPQEPIAISFTDKDSPITKGLADWTTIKEELYNNSAGKLLDTARPLAGGKQTYKDKNGKEMTAESIVAWTNKYNDKTRVFATTLGHNTDTVADDRYLDLVTRGLLWATGHLTDDGKPAAGYEPKK
jgi:type 1 glutamine amidotransferase